jgi:putative ABC transport system permease protein
MGEDDGDSGEVPGQRRGAIVRDDISEELQSHLDLHTADNIRTGMSPDEARRQALIALGGVEQTKERYREARSSRWLDELSQDARFGIRTLIRNPGLTFIAVFSLALAAGATAAIFSIVNSVLLRPLPFGDPERLVQIAETSMIRDDLEALRRQSTAFASFSEYSPATVDLHTRSSVERLTAVVSDRDLFGVLDANPVAGRTFRTDDTLAAVISEQLWRERFGGDANAIGSNITLDDRSFTVVGVMPEAFQFPYGAASVLRSATAEARVDVWIAEHRPLRGRVSRLVARLKPGATAEAGGAEIAAVEARRNALARVPRIERARVVPYDEAVLGPTRRSLWLLFGAVALVLIAACANVANLLLALTSGRMQEIATRAALGASRARLGRQFMIESLLLAFAGGLTGVLVARWTSNLLVAFGAQRIPRLHEVSFDWAVFAFLLIVCAATAVFFGIAPALAAGRVDAGMAMKDSGRATAGRGHGRLRDGLVIAEIALAFVLASGAALVIEEMRRLREADNGMVAENVVTLHLGQPRTEGIESQYYDIADRVSQIPGVRAAGFTQVLPLQNWGWSSSSTDFFVKGTPPRTEAPFLIELRFITPGYFEAMGIRIRAGRGFEKTDTGTAPRVVLINETLARTIFGTADPVGQEMNRGRIVGVVGDVRQVQLDRPTVPEIYTPIAQNWSQVADLGMTLVVRSSGNPNGVIDAVRARVLDVNPRIAIFNVRTMDEVIADSLWNLNLYRWLMGWFAVLTLLLSAVGLYGVVSYSVTSRRREWAVRLALGSPPSDVARIVLMRGLTLAAVGISAGVVLIVVALRSVAADVPAMATGASGATLAAVAALMFAIALGASWLPAIRVARIAPIGALRAQ